MFIGFDAGSIPASPSTTPPHTENTQSVAVFFCLEVSSGVVKFTPDSHKIDTDYLAVGIGLQVPLPLKSGATSRCSYSSVCVAWGFVPAQLAGCSWSA